MPPQKFLFNIESQNFSLDNIEFDNTFAKFTKLQTRLKQWQLFWRDNGGMRCESSLLLSIDRRWRRKLSKTNGSLRRSTIRKFSRMSQHTEPHMIKLNHLQNKLSFIYIPELNVKFLLDTGSSRSFINLNLAHKYYSSSITN